MELVGEAVEAPVVLVELGQLGLPLGLVDMQQLRDLLVGDVQAAGVDALLADGGNEADRGLEGGAAARAAMRARSPSRKVGLRKANASAFHGGV